MYYSVRQSAQYHAPALQHPTPGLHLQGSQHEGRPSNLGRPTSLLCLWTASVHPDRYTTVYDYQPSTAGQNFCIQHHACMCKAVSMKTGHQRLAGPPGLLVGCGVAPSQIYYSVVRSAQSQARASTANTTPACARRSAQGKRQSLACPPHSFVCELPRCTLTDVLQCDNWPRKAGQNFCPQHHSCMCTAVCMLVQRRQCLKARQGRPDSFCPSTAYSMYCKVPHSHLFVHALRPLDLCALYILQCTTLKPDLPGLPQHGPQLLQSRTMIILLQTP